MTDQAGKLGRFMHDLIASDTAPEARDIVDQAKALGITSQADLANALQRDGNRLLYLSQRVRGFVRRHDQIDPQGETYWDARLAQLKRGRSNVGR